MQGPLSGVRILSVDNFFAGNYGPMLLAMHGAEVVKIEQPGSGDALRTDPPYLTEGSARLSHGELRLLRGKDSVAIDLQSEAGRQLLNQLIAVCDVFWTNLRPSSARKIGIDYQSLCPLNPRLVYASVSGFGLSTADENGDRTLPAFDIIIQALSGLMSRNADADGFPHYNGVAVADSVTSIFAALGVMLALYKRAQTGAGDCVDVAMYDSMLALNEKTISLFAMDGRIRPARVSATNSPFGAYRAKDGFIAIGVGSNSVWRRFCKAIGRPELTEAEHVRTGEMRVSNESTVIRPLLEKWLSEKTVEEAVNIFIACDVPAAPVKEVDEILHSPLARGRGIISEVDIGALGHLPLVQSPIQMKASPQTATKAPPALGSGADRVLREWLSMDEEEIEQLRRAAVIG
jgi:crotonobetainyl-CoA:carnitine CoA-transferase CaiB-like acyl-CoA transferase